MDVNKRGEGLGRSRQVIAWGGMLLGVGLGLKVEFDSEVGEGGGGRG